MQIRLESEELVVTREVPSDPDHTWEGGGLADGE